MSLIDRRLQTIQNQVASLDNRFNSLDDRIDSVEMTIGDISTGRAPLTIQLNLPEGYNNEVPLVSISVVPSVGTSLSVANDVAAPTTSQHQQARSNLLTYRLSRGVKKRS